MRSFEGDEENFKVDAMLNRVPYRNFIGWISNTNIFILMTYCIIHIQISKASIVTITNFLSFLMNKSALT